MQGMMPAGGMPAPAMPMPIPNSPSVPPAAINNPSMPMGSGNFFQDIMKAVFDPSGAAKDMAANGITPEQFTEGMKTGNLANVMQMQKRPASVGDVYTKDGTGLMSPLANQPNQPPSSLLPTMPDTSMLSDLMQPVGQSQDAQAIRQASIMGRKDQAMPLAADAATPVFPSSEQIQPIAPPIMPPVAQVNGVGNGSVLPVPPPETIVGQDVPVSSVTGTAPAVTGDPATVPANAGQVSPQNSTVLGGAGGGGLNLSGNRIFTEFMDTVHRGGLTNPNGLAAVAATGKSESAFDPKNAYGSWNDPSEKGVSGTSGGILSWRAERFQAMRNFVKANGGDPNAPSAELQAKYFLQENPGLIKNLQEAKTPEEAQQYMNEAWKFAGYNRPGGERDRRISLARNMVSTFGGTGGDGGVAGTGVGAGDPAAGGVGVGAGAAAAAGVPPVGTAAPTSATSDLMGALDSSGGSSASQDLNLPDAPSPVAPRPGGNPLSADVMKTILAMLAPQMSGNAMQIPTLAQLMSGR